MTPFEPARTLFVGIGTSVPCWYRCALPAMHLGADWCGVRGEPGRLAFVTGRASRPLDEAVFGQYDTVVLQQPQGRAWLGLIRRLQANGATVLFEIDDDVHAVRKRAAHGNRARYGKAVLRDLELTMRACDGLLVSTEFLGRRYRSLNPRAWVCRNGLDTGRFALTPPGGGATVTIGWSGGTGHVEAVVPWLEAVRAVMRRRPDVRFMSLGERFADRLAPEFGHDRAVALPFIELESYPSAMANFDVVIAPGGRSNFHRAKSDLRWLEASALGLPTVADPFVYGDVEHGVTGFCAEDASSAERWIEHLADHADVRRRVGAAAREHVLANRTMPAMARQWATALAEARSPALRASA